MSYSLHRQFALLLLALPVLGQAHSAVDNGVTSLEEYSKPKERTLLKIPDIPGYQTLKCDFHMHTVFSDGLVWPTIRVQEAWQEGLDAISITDHLEYTPFWKDIPRNPNRPHEIAGDFALQHDIILIKGNEVTRYTPPGHFNALFIDDASGFLAVREHDNPRQDQEAIDKVAAQNAFIFWNHPGWKVESTEGSYEWLPFVDQLCRDGKLHGIEVINEFQFHRKAMDWALEHGLTVLGSSDIHNLIAHDYDLAKGIHRTMTLLFVQERSENGVREALEAGRSVAWSTRHLVGREQWVRALFDESVTIGEVYHVDGRGRSYREIRNDSDFHFELQRVDPDQEGWPEEISLNPRTSRILRIDQDSGTEAALYSVANVFISGSENLQIEISAPR